MKKEIMTLRDELTKTKKHLLGLLKKDLEPVIREELQSYLKRTNDDLIHLKNKLLSLNTARRKQHVIVDGSTQLSRLTKLALNNLRKQDTSKLEDIYYSNPRDSVYIDKSARFVKFE